jgi:hypothetical protein
VSRSARAAVVTAVLASAFYALDLRGWELVVPGVPLALALAPLPFRRRPHLRRAIAGIGGVICLGWAAYFVVYGGVLFLPTALFLVLSTGRPRPEPEMPPQTLPVCIDELRAVLYALVTGRYEAAAAATSGEVTAKRIEELLVGYPYRPTSYPPSWLVESAVARRGDHWDVSVPFWTVEEGRSDLAALFRIAVDEDGRCDVELRGIHVP